MVSTGTGTVWAANSRQPNHSGRSSPTAGGASGDGPARKLHDAIRRVDAAGSALTLSDVFRAMFDAVLASVALPGPLVVERTITAVIIQDRTSGAGTRSGDSPPAAARLDDASRHQCEVEAWFQHGSSSGNIIPTTPCPLRNEIAQVFAESLVMHINICPVHTSRH